MSNRLQDRIAIVTGAASGIGRAIALAFADEGAHIIVADIRETTRFQTNKSETESTTVEAIKAKGRRAIFVQTDVTEADQVQSLVQHAVREFGALHIMVNNAGIAFEDDDPQPIWSVPLSSWTKTLAVNTTGVFLGCKYAAAQMIVQDPLPCGDRGWIINTCSILGYVSTENNAAYSASKGAVLNLTRAAALDCAPYRVHVNGIAPGYTESSMTATQLENTQRRAHLLAQHPFRGLGIPDDLAKACVFLASEDAQWITGHTLPVEGGYLAR